MGAFIDLTGKRFGRLVVLEKDVKHGKNWYWKCQCDCGNIVSVDGKSLRGGATKSCGCLNKELTRERGRKTVIDLTGQTFGELTVIERAGSDHRGEALWLCQCSCGSQPIKVLSSNLRNGHTQSCGCIRRSHGERKVEELLIVNHIPFIIEYKFDDLSQYRFDFYITDKQYCIEYDGETHYKANLHGWHNEEQLKQQQKRDKIKNEYCLSHDIPLIRIPYTHLKDLTIDDLKLETSKYLLKHEG